MIDIPWKIFSQTGNIEAYLWMKDVESDDDNDSNQKVENSMLEDTHL